MFLASSASFYCLSFYLYHSAESSPCDFSLSFPQADGDRRTHPTLSPRGPVLGSPHAPLFLPHGLEPEAGGPLPSRLQPVLLLDPSVSHTPLLTGESCCFSREGLGLCTMLRAGLGRDSTVAASSAAPCPPVHILAEPLPPAACPCCFHSSLRFPPHAPPPPCSLQCRGWDPCPSTLPSPY